MGDDFPQVSVGDIVALRKPHPCGENRWEVTRLGADVRLRCTGCERVVAIDRFEFRRRYRRNLESPEG